MTDLKEFVNNIVSGTETDKGYEDIVLFLQSNEWFGIKPTAESSQLLLSDDDCIILGDKLKAFLTHGGTEDILYQFFLAYPKTHGYLLSFAENMKVEDKDLFYLADFLLYRMDKELFDYTDKELAPFIEHATMDLTRSHGMMLTFFMTWLKERTKTNYHMDYVMKKRYTLDTTNGAYDADEYLELMYYLFNEDYIEENRMYEKAADSMNYTDTWLFLSVHFICALRMTDLERIYHPDLIYSPEETIDKIRDNTFSDNDARITLLSITERLCLLPFTPNKTKRTSGVAPIKFHIPSSCEAHFGKLFALAEAHRHLNGKADTPIIRKISTYREISRYMGEEIGSLFRESDFKPRSANKSYLQSVYFLSDDILGEEKDGPKMKGYILAALARSHKGAYGEFASTTFEYLKDAKLSGLTPEFVAFEMLERGVCSFITSMLLKMMKGDDYNNLSVQAQTKAHLSLKLSPFEADSIVDAVNRSNQLALKVVKEALESDEDMMTILHRLVSGDGFSKTSECLCLKTALRKECTDNRHSCVGCHYEISTRSTMYLLIGELNRMKKLYETVDNPVEKTKYKKLIQQLILPKMNEILYALKTDYGEEVYRDFEQMIRENT
jgi:hypothetical protein